MWVRGAGRGQLVHRWLTAFTTVTWNAWSLSAQRSTRASTHVPSVHVGEVEEEASHASTCTPQRPSSYMLVSKMRWSTCGAGLLDWLERERVGQFCAWSMGRSISMGMADGMCIHAARFKLAQVRAPRFRGILFMKGAGS